MASSTKYKYILDSMSTGLIATDDRGGIQYVNRAAMRIFNLSPARTTTLSFEGGIKNNIFMTTGIAVQS